MTDQTTSSDQQPLEPHWDVDWVEEGVSDNLLPWWISVLWLLFVLWGVIYIIDSSSAW